MPFQHDRSRWLVAALLGALWVLSGCAGMASSDSPMAAADPAQLTTFLNEAASGAEREFDQTPWGEAITLRAGERYFAASGRTCRRLLIQQQTDLGARPALACETTDGWESVRALTR